MMYYAPLWTFWYSLVFFTFLVKRLWTLRILALYKYLIIGIIIIIIAIITNTRLPNSIAQFPIALAGTDTRAALAVICISYYV